MKLRENLTRALDEYIEEQMKYRDLPSLAVGTGFVEPADNAFLEDYASATKPDKDSDSLSGFAYSRVAGFKDLRDRQPALEANCYHMASVTKTMTGTALMQLVCQGKLRLSDGVKDLLPQLSIADRRYNDITLEQLLSHTSGLGDVQDYHWDSPRMDTAALADYVYSDQVAETPMVCDPGREFHYSNIAYEILGHIVSQVSGMPYEEYIRTHILEPSGMRNSTLLTFERTEGSLLKENIKKSELVMPHGIDEHKSIGVIEHFPYNREHGPSSTLTSCLSDMSSYAQAVLSCRLLEKETYREMWHERTRVPNNREVMGLAWFNRRQGGYDFYGHEGTDDGFRASFWLCPELGLYTVCMSNISGAPTKKIIKGLTDIVFDSMHGC